MRITKFGHSCLLIEEGSLRILMDPGEYNAQPEVEHVDLILITHEHQDHCDIGMLKALLKRHPEAEIITHEGVGTVLDKEGVPYTPIKEDENIERKGVSIGSRGTTHARLHPTIPQIANTGFLIAARFFYPGDALEVPKDRVEILALPVAGPWLKLEEAIEYARAVHPKIAFPVHDGMLMKERRGSTRALPQRVLEPLGIECAEIEEGVSKNF